jgi:hypothetical protein
MRTNGTVLMVMCWHMLDAVGEAVRRTVPVDGAVRGAVAVPVIWAVDRAVCGGVLWDPPCHPLPDYMAIAQVAP